MRPSRFRSLRKVREYGGQLLSFLCKLDNALSDNYSNFSASELLKNVNLDSSDLVVYVHYSKISKFDEYDLKTIRLLKSHFHNLIVTSNSFIPEEFSEITCLKSKNFGRDLGVMRDILDFLTNFNYSGRVVFLNNSMFWKPGEELVDFILRIFDALTPGTFIGPVESLQVRRHFQSFVVAIQLHSHFKQSENPLGYIRNWHAKRSLVRLGELPMLEILEGYGYTASALVSTSDLYSNTKFINHLDLPSITHLMDEQVHLNPTHHFWSVLYELGVPGIKRSLISSNPAKLNAPPSMDLINSWNNP